MYCRPLLPDNVTCYFIYGLAPVATANRWLYSLSHFFIIQCVIQASILRSVIAPIFRYTVYPGVLLRYMACPQQQCPLVKEKAALKGQNISAGGEAPGYE